MTGRFGTSFISALLSLRWSIAIGLVLVWNASFFVVKRLNVECPPGATFCSPTSKVIFFGTLAMYAAFFLAVVWSEKFRRMTISSRRVSAYNENVFFAVALVMLALIVAFAFFV